MEIDGAERIIRLPIYPAHEYLSAIHDFGDDQLQISCLGSNGLESVGEFWHHVSHLPWSQNHPATQPGRVDRLPYTIPACLFGDDARLFKSDKMVVWQLSFFLSRAPTKLARFIIGVLPYWMIIPGKTLHDVHRAIVWSWQAAFDGRYPSVDHLGQQITQLHGHLRHQRVGNALCCREPRFCIAFVGFKSDLQYDKVTFGFNTYDQRLCCMHCKAVKNGPGPLYTETGPGSAWRAQPRTTESYLQTQRDNGAVQVLTQIPGWCLALHRGDPMHLIFLGFGLHVLGSCLLDLARRGTWGLAGTLKSKLARAWQRDSTWRFVGLRVALCVCLCFFWLAAFYVAPALGRNPKHFAFCLWACSAPRRA